MNVPEGAPAFSELEREECEIELCGPDLYVRYDGWEYYLGEANGPCHPSLDLSFNTTTLRFYGDDEAVVIREIPEDDKTWEISFRVRNVYREDSVDN